MGLIAGSPVPFSSLPRLHDISLPSFPSDGLRCSSFHPSAIQLRISAFALPGSLSCFSLLALLVLALSGFSCLVKLASCCSSLALFKFFFFLISGGVRFPCTLQRLFVGIDPLFWVPSRVWRAFQGLQPTCSLNRQRSSWILAFLVWCLSPSLSSAI